MFFVLARQSSRLPLVRRDQRRDDHDPALGHDRYLDYQARVRLVLIAVPSTDSSDGR